MSSIRKSIKRESRCRIPRICSAPSEGRASGAGFAAGAGGFAACVAGFAAGGAVFAAGWDLLCTNPSVWTMSSGSRPVNKIAKKLRKASTILLKMCLYVLGYTGAGERLATSGCSLAGCLRMPDGFRNRVDAGLQLARKLQAYADDPTVMVLGLPRGGVPVAYEVAKALRAPLDVVVVRKLGVPGHRELAMGAIASGGVRVLNAEVIEALGIAPMTIDAVVASELRELE